MDGLQSTTRALVIAIDRKIADVSNSLKVLATAELLRIGELEGFHRYARRVVRDRPELQGLVLVRPDGQILFNTNLRYGADVVGAVNARELRQAVATGAPAIGPDLAEDGILGTPAITVFVPAGVDGEIKYVLVAFLAPFVISDIFTDQKLPSNWTGVVLDEDATIMGRSRSPEIFIGQPAPTVLGAAILGRTEGVVEYATQEEWLTLAAFARSTLTRWTVVLGMPATSVDVAAGRTLAVVIVTGIVVSLVALTLAAFLGHQISRSVLELLEPALAIARGEPIRSTRRSGIAEIQRVTDRLIRASGILAERDRQRQRAEDHLARAQRVAAIGSWELMLEDDAFHWSDETFRIFGVARDEFRPTLATLSTVILEEDLARLRQPIQLALRGHAPASADLSLDVRVARPNGTLRIVRLEGEPVLDTAAELVGLIGTVQDVTDVRAAEAKRRELEQRLRHTQKMEALGQLTGGIAHDFNNLLAVIIGNLEMAVDRQRRGMPATDLDEASLRAAVRGAGLTRQLLTFARGQPLRPVCQDLRLLIQELLPILKRALTEKITLMFEPPDSACWAEIDSGQFEAALLNLAINARDAMPDGGTLTIAIRQPAEERDRQTAAVDGADHIEVMVRDTGTGMTHEAMARAFEPFFTTKGIGKGSGLGLSMVYGFVRQSGGDIELESTPGAGTVVKLSFRRAEAPIPAAKNKQALPIRFERLHVLLVEDEPEVRETVRSMLVELGARVVTAPDGVTALDIFRENLSIDTIITDVVMPGGMDGITLAEKAAALRSGVRIAFMSGYAALDDRMLRAIDERPFLAKPLRESELAAALEALS